MPRTPSVEMPPCFRERARPLAGEQKPVFSGQSHRPEATSCLNLVRSFRRRGPAEPGEPACSAGTAPEAQGQGRFENFGQDRDFAELFGRAEHRTDAFAVQGRSDFVK
jgi:hypothetical protein